MKAVVKPSKLKGTIVAPPSKSIMHRVLICKFLANANLESKNLCEDTKITFEALNKFNGIDALNMGESASSFRFLLPLSLALNKNKTFILGNHLKSRPIDFIINSLSPLGANIEIKDDNVLTSGKLMPGDYHVDVTVSSQLVSGLLMALPLLDGNSKIYLDGETVSRQYIDMTLAILDAFGIRIDEKNYGFYVRGNQIYKNVDFSLPGDYSNAAYYYVLNKFGADIEVLGLDSELEIEQGDKKIEEFLVSDMGVYDLTQNIDLAPILALYLANKKRISVLTGIKNLSYKESNRIEGIISLLKAFSINAISTDEVGGLMTIFGGDIKEMAEYKSDDHRLLMSAIVGALKVGGTIDGVEYISKSYPSFIDDLKSLGADICLID